MGRRFMFPRGRSGFDASSIASDWWTHGWNGSTAIYPSAVLSTFKLRLDHQFVKSDTAAAIPTASPQIFTIGYEL